MRALVLDRFGEEPTLREVPEPACPPDGAVVRVEATGLCRSDWHALAGHDPDVAPAARAGARVRGRRRTRSATGSRGGGRASG